MSTWTKTGTRDEVREWAARMNAAVPAGSQLSVREIRPGVVEATVRSSAVVPRTASQSRPLKRRWSRRRKLVVTGAVSTALLALAVLGYLAYLWAVAHAALLLGIAVALAVITAVVLRRLGSGGDCTVIHIRH